LTAINSGIAIRSYACGFASSILKGTLMKLKGKVVVVVGGSSGIGLGIAQEAHREGATVVLLARTKGKLSAAENSFTERAKSYAVDIADEASVKKVFESIGPFDHLAITAGQVYTSAVRDGDTKKLKAIFDSRFWGTYFAVRHALTRINRNGSITLMSGTLSRRPAPGTTMLAASVGAIEAFARALAIEVAPIRVNTLRPGLIDTPLLDAMFGDQPREEGAKSMVQANIIKRMGTSEEVGQAAVLLMTNEFITGTILDIDGGRLIN
jgi:NAD(P)-dependent dehydrogenase (short-subunit alcohol dehydrogenase family)